MKKSNIKKEGAHNHRILTPWNILRFFRAVYSGVQDISLKTRIDNPLKIGTYTQNMVLRLLVRSWWKSFGQNGATTTPQDRPESRFWVKNLHLGCSSDEKISDFGTTDRDFLVVEKKGDILQKIYIVVICRRSCPCGEHCFVGTLIKACRKRLKTEMLIKNLILRLLVQSELKPV